MSTHRGDGVIECESGGPLNLAETRLDGRIVQYRILAPTEWNFCPARPFATQLLSSRVANGEVARIKIARLAAHFDPCVALGIKLEAAAHA
jgi:uptake hydrogenase large subunit